MPHPAALPLAGGMGLKPEHCADVLGLTDADGVPSTHAGPPAWVEVHPQNYFMDGGPSHRWLGAIAERLPLSLHSTGLSLGSAAGPDADELDALARLVRRYQPAMVSDHLSWSNAGGQKFPDLLPMPYTHAALDRLVANVGLVQERLGRAIAIENPSRYLAFAGDSWDEVDFIHTLCARAGCSLLLDINNVVVSAHNLGFAAADWLARVDPALVAEIHVAGHSTEHFDDGTSLKIDDHGSAVDATCHALLARFVARAGPRPVLVEWDSHVPALAVLLGEVAAVDQTLRLMADAA